MYKQATTNFLKTKEKQEISTKKQNLFKEPNGNHRIEKYNNQN